MCGNLDKGVRPHSHSKSCKILSDTICLFYAFSHTDRSGLPSVESTQQILCYKCNPPPPPRGNRQKSSLKKVNGSKGPNFGSKKVLEIKDRIVFSSLEEMFCSLFNNKMVIKYFCSKSNIPKRIYFYF